MNTSHVLYWIWLSCCISPGSRASDVLLERFGGSAKAIYEASDDEIDSLDLTEDVRTRLKMKDSAEAKRIYYRCRDCSIALLPYDDARFPERLRTIGKRPVLLYCKGKIPDLNSGLYIAAVGTRRMTSYGKRSAYEISYDLSCAGATIVSGLASGVDAICHRAALDAYGQTVAVLGCGVDVTYPKENFELQNEIEKKGLVLSEFRPGTRPSRTSFPIRNRIISGLCQGTFVVEADKRSGAMITARLAQSQGRNLFSLPGMVGEQNSEGTNELLKDGATPVTCAFDIIDEYASFYPDSVFPERVPIFRSRTVVTAPERSFGKKMPDPLAAGVPDASPVKENKESAPDPVMPDETEIKGERPMPPALTEDEKKTFVSLNAAAAPLSADEICERTGLGAGAVMTALTLLEIGGHVLSLPGGRFLLT